MHKFGISNKKKTAASNDGLHLKSKTETRVTSKHIIGQREEDYPNNKTIMQTNGTRYTKDVTKKTWTDKITSNGKRVELHRSNMIQATQVEPQS